MNLVLRMLLVDRARLPACQPSSSALVRRAAAYRSTTPTSRCFLRQAEGACPEFQGDGRHGAVTARSTSCARASATRRLISIRSIRLRPQLLDPKTLKQGIGELTASGDLYPGALKGPGEGAARLHGVQPHLDLPLRLAPRAILKYGGVYAEALRRPRSNDIPAGGTLQATA